ncbi:MAG: outer membrane beta-barrel protein [Verrucomicrobia bacterium]|nr:outer membrane beta-barrel protein [Verrucomicrobiota bacterium]
MKKLTLSALAVCAVVGSAFAGPAKDFKQPAAPQFFQDKEFALDAFYSYNDAQHRDPQLSKNGGDIIKPQFFVDGSGGGVGVTYFFARYFGVGVEGNWWNGTRPGISQETHDALLAKGRDIPRSFDKEVGSQVTANLILRYPMEFTTFGVAPYIFGGGGALFSDENCGFSDVGAGVEVRITPKVGVFTDWRWNFMTGDNRNDVSTTRAGVRFVF